MSKFNSSGSCSSAGWRQQVGFVADQNGMLLLALVQTHDGFGDLAHQVAAEVRRFQIQFQRNLAQQVQRRAGEKCT